MSNPPNLEEDLPFRRAKLVVQRTFAGQFTEHRTNAELLLLKERLQTKNICRASSETPKIVMKSRPWAGRRSETPLFRPNILGKHVIMPHYLSPTLLVLQMVSY